MAGLSAVPIKANDEGNILIISKILGNCFMCTPFFSAGARDADDADIGVHVDGAGARDADDGVAVFIKKILGCLLYQ